MLFPVIFDCLSTQCFCRSLGVHFIVFWPVCVSHTWFIGSANWFFWVFPFSCVFGGVEKIPGVWDCSPSSVCFLKAHAQPLWRMSFYCLHSRNPLFGDAIIPTQMLNYSIFLQNPQPFCNCLAPYLQHSASCDLVAHKLQLQYSRWRRVKREHLNVFCPSCDYSPAFPGARALSSECN